MQQQEINNTNNSDVRKEKEIQENLFLLNFGANLPLIVHMSIFVFVYIIYQLTYLIPLITDTYNNDASQENYYFFEYFIQTKQTISSNQIYGIIVFIIMHILSCLYIFSAYKVYCTHPGKVQDDFNLQQQIKQQQILDEENKQLNKLIEETKINQPPKMSQQLNRPSIQSLQNESDDCESFVQYDSTIQEEDKAPLIVQNQFRTQGQEAIKQLKNIHLEIVLRSNDLCKECNKCKKFKPPRAHHCRQCQQCILKMDHHCLWINNCVGFYNYKYFMVMLIYAMLLLFFISFTYTRCYIDATKQEINLIKLYFISLALLLSITLMIIVTGFTCFHFWLISQNKTTIEYCENKKDGLSGKYDLGCSENCIQVFNDNCWLFPVNPNINTKGIAFTERKIDQK